MLRVRLNGDGVKLLSIFHAGLSWERIEQGAPSLSDASKVASKAILRRFMDMGVLSSTEEAGNPYQVKRRTTSLKRLFVEVTRECNLSCQHCYNARSNDAHPVMSPMQFQNIMEQAHEMGVIQVDVTGGEPLLHPHILDILGCCTDMGMVINLYTNGSLLDRTLCRRLSNYRIANVIVSLDGTRPETHDSFRGRPGAFAKTVAALESLSETDVNLRLNITALEENCAEVKEVIRLAYERYGAESVVVAPVLRAGKGATAVHRSIDPCNLPPLQAAANPLLKQRHFHDTAGISAPPSSWCGVGRSMAYVAADGTVHACPTLTAFEDARFSLGDITKDSLHKIWQRKDQLPSDSFRCEHQGVCRFAKVCRGGCRSRAFLETNRLRAPDQAMCRFFDYLDLQKSGDGQP